MTRKMIKYSVVPLSLCAASAAFAQNALTPLLSAPDGSVPPVALESNEDPSLNQIRMGMQLGFNMKASFKHIGSFPAASNPGSTNAFSNHTYDNGYNKVDSSTNSHFNGVGNPPIEGTWNWGFTGNNNPDVNGNGSQVHGNGTPGGTISFDSVSSSGGSTGDRVDDPQPGFSLTFARQLIHDDNDRWRGGLEAGFGYTDYDIKDDQPVNAKVSDLRDTYSLNGSFVPVGTSYTSQGFTGNTPPAGSIIIGDTPTRTISTSKMPVTGTREFGADIFAFKLGPYFEVPLNHTFTLGLEGGVAMVYVYSKFQFNEQVANPITGTITTAKGNGNNQDVLFGGFVGSYITAALNDQWSLFAGAQLQDVGDYTHRNRTTGEAAVLDLSQSIFFSAGIGYSF